MLDKHLKLYISEFEALLVDDKMVGDYSYNFRIQEKIKEILKLDINEGIRCWNKAMDKLLYEKRTQDMTIYMVDVLCHEFDDNYVISLLSKNSELIDNLFEKAPVIPENLINLIIYKDDTVLLNNCLSALTKNISRHIIEHSSSLINMPSKQKYLLRMSFDIKEYLQRIDSSSATISTSKLIDTWKLTAIEENEKFLANFSANKESTDLPSKGVNESFLKSIKIDLKNKQKTQVDYFSTVSQNNDIYCRLNNINYMLTEIQKDYSMVMPFAYDGTKNGYIAKYLSEIADFACRLENLSNDDNSINIICAYEKGNEHLFHLLLHVAMEGIFTKGLFGYNIYGLNAFLFLKHNEYASENLVRYECNQPAGKFRHNTDFQSKALGVKELLKAASAFNDNKKYYSYIDESIVAPLSDIAKRIKEWKTVNYSNFDIDSLNICKNMIHKNLLDCGEVTSKWVNERKMYELILSVYPKTQFQYRPIWLDRQSFDVYVPEIVVAFEYQGLQHYKPVEFFGGQKGYEDRKRLDQKKKELANQNGTILIEWRYDEDITKTVLISKLREHCIRL